MQSNELIMQNIPSYKRKLYGDKIEYLTKIYLIKTNESEKKDEKKILITMILQKIFHQKATNLIVITII